MSIFQISRDLLLLNEREGKEMGEWKWGWRWA